MQRNKKSMANTQDKNRIKPTNKNNQSIETGPEEAQILDLVNKDFKFTV